MTLCREWSVVKTTATERYGKPLKCRSWGCEECRPERKSQLLARAAAGAPNRLLTLTVNPRVGSDPEHRARMLAHAWNVLVKRLRRLPRYAALQYLAVVEETKAGEPHLHILLRCEYVPQPLISAAMRDLIDAPVVDIRAVQNVRGAVAYVAKYISKAPAQFGHAKRYWSSKSWELPSDREHPPTPAPEVPWRLVQQNLTRVIDDWIHEGLLARRWLGSIVIAFPPNRGPP